MCEPTMSGHEAEASRDVDLERFAMEVDLETLPSAVLRRLIEEVRQDKEEETHERTQAYNRSHNRHNRSTDHPSVPYNRTHNRHNRS